MPYEQNKHVRSPIGDIIPIVFERTNPSMLGVLGCPNCSTDRFADGFLHKQIVEVFSREENHKHFQTLVDTDGRVWQEIGGGVNPSPRRGSTGIWFTCELCRCEARLVLVQHRGHVVIGWDIVK